MKLRTSKQYSKDEKSVLRSPDGDSKHAELVIVLGYILKGGELPEKYKDHGLSGEWLGYRDCHVRPDLVLIYKRKEVGKSVEVSLARLGSHSEIFG